DPKIWDRETGRIYKICYKGTKPVKVDLRKKTDKELVQLMLHENDWYVRHARRILQERGKKTAIHGDLAKVAFDHKDQTRRRRGLWALHVTGGLTPERIETGLRNKGAYVRAWTIQLALEDGKPSAALLKKLAEMAKKDDSPVVRLYLASACQRLPNKER